MFPLSPGSLPELRIIQVLKDYETVKKNKRYFVLTPGYPYKWETYRWMSIARIAASLGKLINESAKFYLLDEFKKTLKPPLPSRYLSFSSQKERSSLQSGSNSPMYHEASEEAELSQNSEISYISNSDVQKDDTHPQGEISLSGSTSSEYREVSEEGGSSQSDESYDNTIPRISLSSRTSSENRVPIVSNSDSLNSCSTIERSSTFHSQSTNTSSNHSL